MDQITSGPLEITTGGNVTDQKGNYVAVFGNIADAKAFLVLSQLIASIEEDFLSAAREGANADLKHPRRKEWESKLKLLVKAGVMR